MGNKLAKIEEASEFVALAPMTLDDDLFSPEEMKESMGKAPINLGDLERIKVPSGGGVAWEIINEEGEPDVVKSFDAVIVVAEDIRRFYKDKYDGSKVPPDCVSFDLINGIKGDDCPPEVTGICATCPKNQWGSAINDKGQPTKGKACQERKEMLLYREQDMLPVVLSAPSSSLKTLNPYIKTLPSKRLVFWGVVTRFALKKDKTSEGIEYSLIQPSVVRALTPDEVAAVRALREQFTPAMQETAASAPSDE
jgi:hypothetical protein